MEVVVNDIGKLKCSSFDFFLYFFLSFFASFSVYTLTISFTSYGLELEYIVSTFTFTPFSQWNIHKLSHRHTRAFWCIRRTKKNTRCLNSITHESNLDMIVGQTLFSSLSPSFNDFDNEFDWPQFTTVHF